jgi:lipopolysaccharide/colanic/teichoic acid biosynthesis glycosyltransferase
LKYEAFEFNPPERVATPIRPRRSYRRWGKPVFDVTFSLALLPVVALVAVLLLLLNPFFNRGPIFYIQPRMGRGCRAFSAIKFRTMRPVERMTRRADDPLERDRITPLGHFLRRSRIDELPQVINVLRGEMSLIGPRPDYFHHARRYMRSVPGYRRRHDVRPGISGLAQTDLGYVDCTEGTRRKVALDLRYVEEMSLRLDLYVFWRTLVTVFGRKGC